MDEKLSAIAAFCKKSGCKFKLDCSIYDDGEIHVEGGLYLEEFSPCSVRGSSVEEVVDKSLEFAKSYQ